MCLPLCRDCALPRRGLPSEKKNAQLIEPDADADPGAIGESIMKRPAGAESIIKRPAGAGIDAGNEPTKKRPATGAAMKHTKGKDCTAIVQVDDPDATTKDRNKWAFLMRNKTRLDPRVHQMLEGANQKGTAVVVNNAVRRDKNGDMNESGGSLEVLFEECENSHILD